MNTCDECGDGNLGVEYCAVCERYYCDECAYEICDDYETTFRF